MLFLLLSLFSFENITFLNYSLFTKKNNIAILKEIIDTAHKDFIVKDNNKLNIYAIHEWGHMW